METVVIDLQGGTKMTVSKWLLHFLGSLLDSMQIEVPSQFEDESHASSVLAATFGALQECRLDQMFAEAELGHATEKAQFYNIFQEALDKRYSIITNKLKSSGFNAVDHHLLQTALVPYVTRRHGGKQCKL